MSSHRWYRRLLPLLLGMLLPAIAHADGADLWPESGRGGALQGRIAYNQDDQSSLTQRVVAPVLAGHHAFSPRWSMSGEGGFVFIDSNPDVGEAQTAFGLANPTGLAYFRPWPGASHQLRFGLGGSLPMSLIARGAVGRLQRAAISNAAGMEGLTRMELWAPSRGSFIGLTQLRGPLGDRTSYELQLRATVPIAVVRRAGENRVDVFLPLSAGLVSREGRFEGGVRLHAVLTPTSNVDSLQLSLAPHVRVHSGRAWLGLRLLAPLDEPLAGDRGARVWGLFLESGGEL